MGKALDRAAGALAAALLAWAAERLEPSRRLWLEALRAELEAIDGGGKRLAWAMGGLWLLWLEWKRAWRLGHGFWSVARNSSQTGMMLGVLLLILIVATRNVSENAFPWGPFYGALFLYLGMAGLRAGRRTRSVASGAQAGAITGVIAACFALLAFFLQDHLASGLLGVVALPCYLMLIGAACGMVGAVVGTQLPRVRR